MHQSDLPSPSALIGHASRWWTSLRPDYQPALQPYFLSLMRALLDLLHGSASSSHVSLAREVEALSLSPDFRTPLTPSSAPTNPGSTSCGEPT